VRAGSLRVRSSLCTRVVLTAFIAVQVTAVGNSSGTTLSPSGAMSSGDVGPTGSGSGDPNLGTLNQGTRTLNFDEGWRFKLVNPAGVTDPSGAYGNSSDPKAAGINFNDSSWERVTLPHDWSITLQPDPSQTNATGYFPGGLDWCWRSRPGSWP
jgi:beta-galactosidase